MSTLCELDLDLDQNVMYNGNANRYDSRRTKQTQNQYKMNLDAITKENILDQIEKIHDVEIPDNLVQQELAIITQSLKKDDIEKHKKEIWNYKQKEANWLKTNNVLEGSKKIIDELSSKMLVLVRRVQELEYDNNTYKKEIERLTKSK